MIGRGVVHKEIQRSGNVGVFSVGSPKPCVHYKIGNRGVLNPESNNLTRIIIAYVHVVNHSFRIGVGISVNSFPVTGIEIGFDNGFGGISFENKFTVKSAVRTLFRSERIGGGKTVFFVPRLNDVIEYYYVSAFYYIRGSGRIAVSGLIVNRYARRSVHHGYIGTGRYRGSYSYLFDSYTEVVVGLEIAQNDRNVSAVHEQFVQSQGAYRHHCAVYCVACRE